MTADIHTLSGAYALNALETLDRVQFDRHLAACDVCREEVDSFVRATVALAEHEAVAPPAELRAKVLATAARTAQARPLPAPLVSAKANATRELRRRHRGAKYLAAAAAIAAFSGGTVALLDIVRDTPASVVISADSVFGAADARVERIALAGGQARVGISKSLGLVAVDGHDLPALKPSRIYQLWIVDDRGATSVGVMREPSMVMQIPKNARVAVTSEPNGGSTQPTTEPLFAVDPTQI